MSFGDNIAAYAKAKNKTIDTVIKAVSIELFGSVIEDTPRDTGRAQNNWQATYNTPAGGEVDSLAATQSVVSGVTSKVNAAPEGAVLFLTNNLPYIAKLETNNAMVRKNVARISSAIKSVVRKAEGGL